MKKALVVLTALWLVVSLGISSAHAVPITFFDTTRFTAVGTVPSEDYVDHGWGKVKLLKGFGDYVIWTHHFEFDPPAQSILSGRLRLWLRDDEICPADPPKEYAFLLPEDLNWRFGEVDTRTYGFNVTTSYLEDGEFTVLLASLGGDFYIDKSRLKITYEPIPEPTSMMLLGMGLLGLLGLRRKT